MRITLNMYFKMWTERTTAIFNDEVLIQRSQYKTFQLPSKYFAMKANAIKKTFNFISPKLSTRAKNNVEIFQLI